MKSPFYICLPALLVVFFQMLPGTAVFACGSGGSCKMEKSKEKSGCKKACCKGTPSKKHNDCGGNCGDKGCGCPGASSHSPGIATPHAGPLPEIILSNKAELYYLQVLPKPVWLSIWLPPKISC